MIESLASFIEFQAEDQMRADVTTALVLNGLLGNGDAHMKNFGVLYHDNLDVPFPLFTESSRPCLTFPKDVPALALPFEWHSERGGPIHA